MAIRAGQLIHIGNQVLLDRLQTGGPGLQVPIEKIYELGNEQSVAQVRDTADLNFSLESIDVSAELEALLLHTDFATDAAGTEYAIANALPIDVAGQFKKGRKDPEPFEVEGSVAAPYLVLEQLSYRFGIRDNAGVNATLRGDALYWAQGGTVIQEVAGTNAANQAFELSLDGGVTDDFDAILYSGDTVSGDRWALSVTLVEDGVRLTHGADYTEAKDRPSITGTTPLGATPTVVTADSMFNLTIGGATYADITLTDGVYTRETFRAEVQRAIRAATGGQGVVTLSGTSLVITGAKGTVTIITATTVANDALGIMGFVTAATDVGTGATTITVLEAVPVTDTIRVVYQTLGGSLEYLQATHALASATRPAAVKGRDIEILVGGVEATDRWTGVQSVTVDYRVSLEKDEELGNSQVVAQDYDVPEVSGSIEIKPVDFDDFMDRLYQITGVSAAEVVGPYKSVPLSLDVVIHSPDDGSVVKTLHVPDARFVVPGYQGRVQQKSTMTLAWDGDSGSLLVYKNARP